MNQPTTTITDPYPAGSTHTFSRKGEDGSQFTVVGREGALVHYIPCPFTPDQENAILDRVSQEWFPSEDEAIEWALKIIDRHNQEAASGTVFTFNIVPR